MTDNKIKHFRHICASGSIWDSVGPPDEIHTKCPMKEGCDRGWEEVYGTEKVAEALLASLIEKKDEK